MRGEIRHAHGFCQGAHRFNSRLSLVVRRSPGERGSRNGIIEQHFQLVVEFKEGHGSARHVERSHEVAHESLISAYPQLVGQLAHGGVEDIKLALRRGAEAVDDDGDLVALFQLDDRVVREQGDHLFRQLVRGGVIVRALARLSVYAHAELYLVICKVEDGRSLCGRGARRERKAYAGEVVDRLLRHALDFFQVFALLSRRARYLMHEDRPRDAAPAHDVIVVGIRAALHRDVVVDEDALDVQALVLARVRTRAVEVHAVARIVLDYHQSPLVRGGELERVIYLHLRGRGEHVAAYRRVEHARAHKARMRGFVSRTAARDERDLFGIDLFFLYYLVFFHKLKLGVRQGDAAAHIRHISLRGVHYLFHAHSPYLAALPILSAAMIAAATISVVTGKGMA